MKTSEASTRQRVLGAIMAQDATTATELAGLLGLTSAAVRRHLEALEDEGLIGARQHRSRDAARGRPAKVFAISDKGRDQFHQAYGELAAQAIAQLIATAGPDGLDSLAKAHFGPIQDVFEASRSSDARQSRVEALVAALDAGGYAADAHPLGNGDQLCQHHCPVADVARIYPELCELETQMLASLLESHVQRLATIAHGDGVCTTHIPGPVERKNIQ
ncbi:MAG: winged helix-turn-helix transcriptional regulator [Propionibacteriaceae bacterium]|nr:winged helix-turn-helix transcriptional regulator [Propionibacteriaceae bacterium]